MPIVDETKADLVGRIRKTNICLADSTLVIPGTIVFQTVIKHYQSSVLQHIAINSGGQEYFYLYEGRSLFAFSVLK